MGKDLWRQQPAIVADSGESRPGRGTVAAEQEWQNARLGKYPAVRSHAYARCHRMQNKTIYKRRWIRDTALPSSR